LVNIIEGNGKRKEKKRGGKRHIAAIPNLGEEGEKEKKKKSKKQGPLEQVIPALPDRRAGEKRRKKRGEHRGKVLKGEKKGGRRAMAIKI